MDKSAIAARYKEIIAAYLHIKTDQVFLFWKGRVALYALLKSFGVGEGDEVILPAFTCVVVPNAILYLGAKPVYVDIDARTYNINPDLIEKKITKRTKLILAQNTFGLPPDLDSILSMAKINNLKVIEDCTHGFGGHYNGRENGTITEASFFSTQWNKPFSTGIGGFAVINDSSVASRMKEIQNQLDAPSIKDELMLRFLITARNTLQNPSIYYPMLDLYRWLSKNRIIIGSSESEELRTISMPEHYMKAMGVTQVKHGIKELNRIDAYIEKRKKIAKHYNKTLKEKGITIPFSDEMEHTFLKYPLLVKDKIKFFAQAKKEKINIGDWFVSPLHPITTDLEKWNYPKGDFPVAERISQHIVNLPTDPFMNDKNLQKVLRFISKNSQMIIS